MHAVSSRNSDVPPTLPSASAPEVFRLSPAARLTRRLEQLRELAQEFATEKDLAAARDNLTKERDQARAERDNIAKERDALKKTASDRAMRIAELEAQVSDQAERQKQIDEEMAKAEGQLHMLKDFLRPSLP